MPKGNPNPVITPEFEAAKIKRSDDTTEPLAEKPVRVRLTRSADEIVRAMPSQSAWLRKVVIAALHEEGLMLSNSPEPAIANPVENAAGKPPTRKRKEGDR